MPIIIPIIIAVAALAIGTGTAVVLKWDEIMTALKGKKLAVLGARKVGKTVLIKYLTTGTVTEDYKQTRRPEKTPARRFRLEDLDLAIKKSYDVPGKDHHKQWKDITKESDIVLYLLRIDKLMEGDEITEERIRGDMELISSWLEENPKKFPLFIIGTYFDRLSESKIEDYQDSVRQMPIFETIELLATKSGSDIRVILGSLRSKRDTEELVHNIFSQVIG